MRGSARTSWNAAAWSASSVRDSASPTSCRFISRSIPNEDASTPCRWWGGEKIDWIRANPKVCVEVEDIADGKHWTTVLVFGRYERFNAAAAAEMRVRAEQLFQQRQQWWFPAAPAQVGSPAC